MLPAIGASLISGGLSAISGLFNNYANYKAQQSANNANMELAKYSYSQNLEQWNRQNEYNTPAAQMQRYADAGLNPNLIYGQGSNGNAGSSPQFSPPTVQPASMRTVDFGQVVGNMINQYQNLRLQQNQLNLQEKELTKADAEIENIRSQTEFTQSRNSVALVDVLLRNQKLGYNAEYLPLMLANMGLRNSNLDLRNQTLSQGLSNMVVQKQLYEAQIKNIDASTELKYFEKQKAKAMLGLQLRLLDSQIGMNLARTTGINYDNALKQWDADYVKSTGMKPADGLYSWLTNIAQGGVKYTSGFLGEALDIAHMAPTSFGVPNYFGGLFTAWLMRCARAKGLQK